MTVGPGITSPIARARYTPRVLETQWLKALSGKFIVFEGPDGSGKTTQFRRFVRAAEGVGLTVCEVREPGGTGVGEKIREVLLDHAHKDMTLTCEMLLYMASRAQLIEQKIVPALKRGELVAADRFLPSTLAYQGTAGGMPIKDIGDVARVALRGCRPDLVIVFDVDQDTAAKRLSPLLDRMEAKGAAFHQRVRQGYLDQAAAEPGRYLKVDASGGEEEVWKLFMDLLRARLR